MKNEKFEEYKSALQHPLGDMIKNLILAHAASNPSISLSQLIRLMKLAYPGQV